MVNIIELEQALDYNPAVSPYVLLIDQQKPNDASQRIFTSVLNKWAFQPRFIQHSLIILEVKTADSFGLWSSTADFVELIKDKQTKLYNQINADWNL